MIDEEKLRQLCKDCPHKLSKYKCPMHHKDMCPDHAALKASMVLEDSETAQLVPLDVLLKALRSHGYTGELRKAITVTI